MTEEAQPKKRRGSIALTEMFLTSLTKPTGRRHDYYDAAVKGLIARQSALGKVTLAIGFQDRVSRRNYKFTLGPHPIISLAEARKRARAILAEVAANKNPAVELRQRREAHNTLLFPVVVDEFIAKHSKVHLRPKTIRAHERVLRKEFKGWDNRTIDQITRKDVIAAINIIRDRGAHAMAAQTLVVLKSFFSWTIERGLIDRSPCADVTVKHTSKRERVLSDDEIVKVWLAAIEMGHPFGDVVRLLLLLGCRLGEVAGMRWDEIDLGQGVWAIRANRTKTKKEHLLPLSTQALEIIKSVPRTGDELFPCFPVEGTAINEFQKRIFALSGTSGWHRHDLRRTASTGMARLQIAPHVVERILGHSTGTISAIAGIYNRYQYLPEMAAALQQWADHIGQLVGKNHG